MENAPSNNEASSGTSELDDGLCINGVPLPNDQWIRSTTKPEWAICLDPAARFYGWKMYECNGAWVSGGVLTLDEVCGALAKESLRQHWPLFQPLHDKMMHNAKSTGVPPTDATKEE